MLSAALSLMLLAAQQTPPEADAPVATQRSTPTIPPGPARDPNDLPVPAGAPSDDFGLVSWCHGALRGHMQLAEQIGESDEEQQAIGRDYLKSYEVALAAAPQSKTTEGARLGAAARQAGNASWAAARTSQNRETQKFAYLGWQLPGRCEHAAKRLSANADLLGAALAPARSVPSAGAAVPTAEPPQPTGDPSTSN